MYSRIMSGALSSDMSLVLIPACVITKQLRTLILSDIPQLLIKMSKDTPTPTHLQITQYVVHYACMISCCGELLN